MLLEWAREWLARESEFWKDLYHELPLWQWICWGIFFAICMVGVVIGLTMI